MYPSLLPIVIYSIVKVICAYTCNWYMLKYDPAYDLGTVCWCCLQRDADLTNNKNWKHGHSAQVALDPAPILVHPSLLTIVVYTIVKTVISAARNW
jgi:hypothetical protein